MVRVAAAGETGSLPKAKTANSSYLYPRYILPVLVALSTDYSTGAPGVDKKTQCDLLAKEFGFQHIYLGDVLRERSDNQTYLHAKFLKDCLEEDVHVPIQLAISLLEWKINEGIKEGKRWSLVRGFPENTEQLVEFKKKVSVMHVDRTLFTSIGPKIKLHAVPELLIGGITGKIRCRESLRSRGVF